MWCGSTWFLDDLYLLGNCLEAKTICLGIWLMLVKVCQSILGDPWSIRSWEAAILEENISYKNKTIRQKSLLKMELDFNWYTELDTHDSWRIQMRIQRYKPRIGIWICSGYKATNLWKHFRYQKNCQFCMLQIPSNTTSQHVSWMACVSAVKITCISSLGMVEDTNQVILDRITRSNW